MVKVLLKILYEKMDSNAQEIMSTLHLIRWKNCTFVHYRVQKENFYIDTNQMLSGDIVKFISIYIVQILVCL